MTAPSVRSENSGVNPSNPTSHTITLPATIEAGDLLVLAWAVNSTPSVTGPSGWTEFMQDTAGSGSPTLYGYYKDAVGDEDSTDITITTGVGRSSAYKVWAIQDAIDPSTTEPEESTAATGLTVNPDPPSLAPAGGADDYLFLAVHANDSGNQNTTGFPSGYSGTGHENTEDGGGGVGLGWAYKSTTGASSENPGTFTIDNARDWTAQTIAIYPTSGATPITVTVPTGPLR